MSLVLLLMIFMNGCMFRPGFSASDTAGILIDDRDFGMRVVKQAIGYGDKIIAPLSTCSQYFTLLDNRNSSWVAKVLGSIKTDSSFNTLKRLERRQELFPKLVGITGLIMQNKYNVTISDTTFLIQCLLGKNNVDRGGISDDTYQELAADALGLLGKKEAVPYLCKVLLMPDKSYQVNSSICEALQNINDASAVNTLKDALSRDDFYALPEAFCALVSLNETDAITLAIKRINPGIKNYNSGFVVDKLCKVTGKNYGYDGNKWNNWWAENKNNWSIPREFINRKTGFYYME